MQVAYVCADAGVPVFGMKGCSIHVQEIVRAFGKRGDKLTLLATRLGGKQPDDLDIANLDFPIPSGLSLVERERAQVVAAERIARAVVTSAKPFDLVYERYSLWSSASMRAARQREIHSVLEVNSPLIEEQQTHREISDLSLAEQIRHEAFSNAGTIITVSEEVAGYVRAHLNDSDSSKVHVVPNGVDVERFAPTRFSQTNSREFTVGFLGTLKPWHGLESLLSAFEIVYQRFPSARLRIIGDGPLREELQDRIQNHRPQLQSQIDWVGAVSPLDVPCELSKLDVAVAPYLESDEFYFSPLKVYEYMAAGRAVVASQIGQISTLIQDNINGCLYTAGDFQRLAAILIDLASDPNRRSRLGIAARECMAASHSWDSTLARILSHVLLDQRITKRPVPS
ncbi:MAG: glycosyltransferase family 4 protein [Pirellulaceae bacterium]|nr:glycosyltransferase family 4 protein [Pirellulaceae bacterium]